MKNVPRRIHIIESLEEVTTEIAAEAFEQSCNMKSEWARWLLPYGIAEELVEVNIIFAVRPSNIHTVPKVIPLLGAMHVIVALPPKETPVQCTHCGEWSHKKDTCAKRPQCYHYGSQKHTIILHK